MSHTTDDLTFSWDTISPISIHQENEALKTPQFKIPKAAIKTKQCTDQAYYSGINHIINISVKFQVICHTKTPHFCFIGSYPCLLIEFRLERSLQYHMIHTYIPSGSVVLLSWITFWMKAEAIAARFGLGVTALLTLGNHCINHDNTRH